MSIEIKGGSRRRGRRRRGSRLIVGIIATIVTLLIFGVIAGLGYVWYTGQQEPIAPEPFPERSSRQAQSNVTEKPKASPEGPVGVSQQVFTSPVGQGDNASVTIRTRPEAACSITLTYRDNIRSKDAGLLPKTADEFGTAQWTWTVEPSRPVGTWPVEITCGLGEMSGYLKLNLEVVPK